ncbi:MAG: class I SAM-dependent methyltransferase, partial [Nitrospirales bacterium]
MVQTTEEEPGQREKTSRPPLGAGTAPGAPSGPSRQLPPVQVVGHWSGKAREDAVQRMFTAIARGYDLNNSLLSFGLHHRWKREAVRDVPALERGWALDLGAGTGDLALRLTHRMGAGGHVAAVDLNAAMLRVGLHKIRDQHLQARITCLRGNADTLAARDESMDVVTAGFCIRNVGNLPQTFREIRRILKPGGRFVCLEFSHPANAVLRRLYDWYSFRLLPCIGRVVARDSTGVYDYLPASIRTFPDQARLCGLLREAGFREVDYRNLTGGIVAIHIAVK